MTPIPVILISYSISFKTPHWIILWTSPSRCLLPYSSNTVYSKMKLFILVRFLFACLFYTILERRNSVISSGIYSIWHINRFYVYIFIVCHMSQMIKTEAFNKYGCFMIHEKLVFVFWSNPKFFFIQQGRKCKK